MTCACLRFGSPPVQLSAPDTGSFKGSSGISHACGTCAPGAIKDWIGDERIRLIRSVELEETIDPRRTVGERKGCATRIVDCALTRSDPIVTDAFN